MEPSAPSISTTSAPGGDNVVYNELLPVLIQCFAIILLGYFSGRVGLIGHAETRSLNVFVSYFALPATAFKSLAAIALGEVNWRFLAALALGKCVIFAVVAAVTLALVRRPASFGKAGLYAIAASQSNDFGLGYPLIVHLYEKMQPTFSHYLYLVAPIQLAFLNPIAFVMMEYGRTHEDSGGVTAAGTRPATPRRGRFLSTLTGIVKNPVVVAPALALVWNASTSGAALPSVVQGILDSFGDAFIATALYLLGLSMVGKVGSMGKYAALTPVLLVSAKIVASPLVTRELVNLLGVGNNERDQKDFSNFGFLYGMLPMAPSVFIFATQYELPTAAVSTAMVAGTFLSAPFIFITATMSQIKEHCLQDFAATMGKTMVSSSAVSAVCCLWLLVVLFRRRDRVTHGTTIYLVVCQLATALGGVLWAATSIDDPLSPLAYAQSVLSIAGIFASRVWTAILAGLLALLHWRSLCFVLRLKWLIAVAGFGFSILAALLLCLSIPKRGSRLGNTDPNFQFGDIQAVVAVTVLLTSLLFTVVSLIFQHRFRLRMRDYVPIGGSSDDEQSDVAHSDVNSPLIQPSSSSQTRPPGAQEEAKGKSDGCTGDCEDCANCSDEEEHSVVPDLEDLISSSKPNVKAQRTKFSKSATLSKASSKSVNSSRFEFNVSPAQQTPSTSFDQLCGPQFNCDKEQVRQCMSLISTYNRQTAIRVQNTDEALDLDSVVEADDDIHQVFRHTVLVLLLSVSMVIGLAVSLWQLLLTDAPTGILVELEFVDIILNYGQGMLTFLVFGLDGKWLLRWLSGAWYFVSCRQRRQSVTTTLILPKFEDLSPEARQICTQFHVYHRDSCVTDICHSRHGPDGTELHLAFVGRDLVDWLLAVGLCQDRVQATRYGKRLLEGRVIAHVTGRHHFCDELYTYTFLPSHELDVSS
ncbi:lysosomal cholesterol signaling protein-like [Dermacentor variabilis]|uniref:lysosomal cholesterol signaling protein-like n=1 Tax=Dermacentor variabilis TaxID=34621 RepID=UPI003F5B0D90